MTEIFYNRKESNLFDKIVLDVKKVYDEFLISKKINSEPNKSDFIKSYFYRIYRNRIIPKNIRNNLWYFFRRIKLDLTWFKIFNNYWKNVIKGRPLFNVEDLSFLKNLYRIKFQSIQVPDTNDSSIHLEAWQRPELIYQLLHLVCKEFTSNEFMLLNLVKKKKKKFNTILEFGCGTAPITTSLYEFFKVPKNMKIFISDIQTIAFHYAAYKFRKSHNVVPILLEKKNDFLLDLDEKVDLIFCKAVFEHLNKPLKTTEKFNNILNKNGLLIFDYIKTSGDYLDTHQSMREREEVLDYINKHFQTVYGKIDKEKSIKLTIVKKN